MQYFDISKVICGINAEKAEVGKEYWFSNSISCLKEYVEENDSHDLSTLQEVLSIKRGYSPFVSTDGSTWEYIYPYEDPSKKRMTNIQLAEWIAKGKGLYSYQDSPNWYTEYSCITCSTRKENEEVKDDLVVRTWDSAEWIKPTYEIYLRDCKGITQDEIDDVAYRDGY